MRFANPAWLALIWAAPVALALFAWGHGRRRRTLGAFAARETLPRIAGEPTGGRRWAGAILLAGGLLAAAVAAAGPLYGFHWRTTERRGVDLIVALDCSRSMLATDVKPSRLERAKREVFDLIHGLEGDRVGLVGFAGTAFLQCPLTLDYGGLHLFLDALTPDYLPVGGTALADALDTARESFDPKSPADRAVVLITDGEETTGAAEEAAGRLRDAGIRVFVLGVGTPEGAPIPAPDGGFVKDGSGSIVLARLGEDALTRLADRTGGAYARSVPGDGDRDALLAAMGSDLEARTLEARRVQVWEDRYQWPLVLALLAVLVELALPLRRRELTAVVLVLLAAGGARAESAGALARQGLERYQAEDFAAARDAWTRAQVEAPEAPELAFDLGNAHYRAGDYEKALESYGAAARTAPPDLKAQALYNRGNAAYRLGKLPEAAADYEAALKVAPEDEDARANLEFVRQKLEEQQQKRQDGGHPPPDDQQKPSSDEKDAAMGSGEQAPKESSGGPSKEESKSEAPPAPQEGKRPGESQSAQRPESGAKPDSKAEADRGSSSQEPRNDQTAAEAPGGEGTDAGDAKFGEAAGTPSRARALLNRLKDEPGKAAVPAYGARRVEKDW